MSHSINTDEYTFISEDGDGNTQFHDLATGKLLFENLPASISCPKDELVNKFPNLDSANISISEEGTTLRVFYNKKWYTSSKRKLQAFKSNWADKSTTFGATFAQAVRNELDLVDDSKPDQEFLEMFYDTYLDKTKVYFFLLRSNKGERIVCYPPRHATAIHICTQFDLTNDFNERIQIDIGTFRHTRTLAKSWEEIDETLAELDYRHHQGVIIHNEGNFYKLLQGDYEFLSGIRQNIASLKMCYLSYREPEKLSERLVFLELYPEFAETVDSLEEEIYLICCNLHSLYMRMFVHKEKVNIPDLLLNVLKMIHKEYLISRIQTTVERINDILTPHTVLINKLLKSYKKHVKATS